MSVLLQRELERAIDGEVRFDPISRALYSTDASVYQIEPVGVVIPKSQEAVIRAVAIASSWCGIMAARYANSLATIMPVPLPPAI